MDNLFKERSQLVEGCRKEPYGERKEPNLPFLHNVFHRKRTPFSARLETVSRLFHVDHSSYYDYDLYFIMTLTSRERHRERKRHTVHVKYTTRLWDHQGC